MDADTTRRLVRGILTLVLTTLATWLAGYLTDRILGPEEDDDLSLEKGLKLCEEGIACLRDASAELSKAEAAVQVLRERTDGVLEATDLRA